MKYPELPLKNLSTMQDWFFHLWIFCIKRKHHILKGKVNMAEKANQLISDRNI